jgi:hypothetical protein
MEVLACIPELSCPAGFVAAAVTEPSRPADMGAVVAGQVSTKELAAPAADTDADAAECVAPAPRRTVVRRSQTTRFPAPSIIALVAVAAAFWAAAWRNDRLRLEAARQQRPERLAQELPAAAGAARSVTP